MRWTSMGHKGRVKVKMWLHTAEGTMFDFFAGHQYLRVGNMAHNGWANCAVTGCTHTQIRQHNAARIDECPCQMTMA